MWRILLPPLLLAVLGCDSQATTESLIVPAGQDEPVFDSGAHVSMFYDGFESYSSVSELLTDAGAHRYLGSVDGFSLGTSGAAAGSKKVVVDFQGAGETDRTLESLKSEMTGNAGAGPAVVVASWYLRNPGAAYEGKMWISITPGRLLLHSSRSPMSPESLKTCYYDGSEVPRSGDIPPLKATVPTWDRDHSLIGFDPDYSYKQNMGWAEFRYEDMINDGTWHRYTTRFTRGPSYGEGRLEMWVDGVKITEYIGDDPGRCEAGQVYVPVDGPIIPAFQWPGPSAFDWAGGPISNSTEIRVWHP